MPQKNDKTEHTLETAMAKISTIVASMEEGNMPLEKLIDSYEEGVSLVRLCEQKLEAAEKRVRIISRDARGNDSLADFQEEAP